MLQRRFNTKHFIGAMFTPLFPSPPHPIEIEESLLGNVFLSQVYPRIDKRRRIISANTLPTMHRVVVSGPILCPPHEYLSANICVGGLPTFISYSSTVFWSKWDARHSHVSALICTSAPSLFSAILISWMSVFVFTFLFLWSSGGLFDRERGARSE